MDPLARDALVRRRHGVVLRSSLFDLGYSPMRLTREIGQGLWRPGGPGIVIHHSARLGLATASRVAGLWRPDQLLTGPSAAVLRPHPAWADSDLGTQAYMIYPRTGPQPWRNVRHPGARATTLDGFTLADPHSTVVDLLRFLPYRTALAIGAGAVRTGLTSVDRLHDEAARLARLRGVSQLRSIARVLASGAHSLGEVDVHAALRRAGITGWIANYEVVICGRRYVLDIAFVAERVYLEFDGMASHNTRAAFDNDRRRQNDLATGAWQPLRVTWSMLRDHEEEVMARVRATLAARRGLTSP